MPPALARGSLGGGHIEVAFPEVERNFIERALSPLFRLRLPEDPAFGIQQGALPAKKFLIANFYEPVHAPHSLGEANLLRHGSRVGTASLSFPAFRFLH